MSGRQLIGLIGALVLAPLAAVAVAQEGPPRYGRDVTIGEAKKIAAAAVAEAQRKGYPVAIAIVDNHGLLVYFERLDDTQTGSVPIAMDKARTAAIFRRPSRVFDEIVEGGDPAVLGLRGVTPVTGGLPILRDGKVVGGIGVSGVRSAQDEEVAKAGLAALK